MKRTQLLRRTPIKKKRSKPRRGEPTAEEKTIIREREYIRSGGRCELRLPGCKGGVLPFVGSVLERWHLVHKRARRRFGWGPENLRGGCYHCHIEMVHTKGVRPDTL